MATSITTRFHLGELLQGVYALEPQVVRLHVEYRPDVDLVARPCRHAADPPRAVSSTAMSICGSASTMRADIGPVMSPCTVR